MLLKKWKEIGFQSHSSGKSHKNPIDYANILDLHLDLQYKIN